MKIKKSKNHDDDKFKESFLVIVSATFGAVMVRHVEPLFLQGLTMQNLINFGFAFGLVWLAIFLLFCWHDFLEKHWVEQ